jgi:hypothetical protein
MNQSLTFWELLRDNKIEVPVIQRDYAQGRAEDKIKAIRVKFVSDLKENVIKSQIHSLHLGFVYGKIEGKDKFQERERNKRAIENILNAVEGYAHHLEMKIESKIEAVGSQTNDSVNLPTFIPLDGQQRLTTLYLLHWYLNLYTPNNEIEQNLRILSHFTYKTRKSSMEFCASICVLKNLEELRTSSDLSIAEVIKNEKWFRKTWLKDSTVSGMLNMLEEIEAQFKIEDKNNLFEQLIDNKKPRIIFDFLDLNELNQTDELYVKMNARGKQLTEFEHFKAWLQHYVKISNYLIEEKDWTTKIDKKWLDLFWKNKEKGTFYVDDIIYNAFKQIVLLEYIATEKEPDKKTTVDLRDQDYLPFSFYEEIDFFNAKTLNFLFNSLERLSDINQITIYNNWLTEIACPPFVGEKVKLSEFFLTTNQSVDRPETVYYYAFLLYLNYSSKPNDKDCFKSWMRITRNLIFNTYIQSPENFIDAIKSLTNLVPYIDSIASDLGASELKISFFRPTIVTQEATKVELIERSSSGADWKKYIHKYENHLYFNGDIGFLLNFSLTTNEGEENNLAQYSYKEFKYYGDRASILFEEEIRTHTEVLLQRAILAKGDYLPLVGSNYLFCLPNKGSLRARRDNWQRVLNDSEHNQYLKALIQDDLKEVNDVESSLEKVIEKYSLKDWRYYFIKEPQTISFCSNDAKGFIRWNGEDEVFLLKTTRAYGRHAELRSYYFHNKITSKLEDILPFEDYKYWVNRMGQYPFPCIRFYNWKYQELSYKLEITYRKEGTYLIQVLTDDGSQKIHENIIIALKEQNWNITETGFNVSTCIQSETELEEELKTTLTKLSNLP